LEQEIFKALLSIGTTKSLGPDGFIAIFYQTYWSIVKEVVLNCVWDFFSKSSFAKGAESYFYCSYPKTTGAVLSFSFSADKFMQHHLQNYLQNFGKSS
jgi:hypothetical protein